MKKSVVLPQRFVIHPQISGFFKHLMNVPYQHFTFNYNRWALIIMCQLSTCYKRYGALRPSLGVDLSKLDPKNLCLGNLDKNWDFCMS